VPHSLGHKGSHKLVQIQGVKKEVPPLDAEEEIPTAENHMGRKPGLWPYLEN
jgi:hypothetical protein